MCFCFDSGLDIALQSGSSASISGRTVTVPYQITGANAGNATRVSFLILDKEYSAGNKDNAKILYYDGLTGTSGASGTGSFTLPSDLKPEEWGIKYFVYILAEDINGAKETDYASVPVRIDISNGGGQWIMDSNGWSYRNAHGHISIKHPGIRIPRAGGSAMIPDGMLRAVLIRSMEEITSLTLTDTARTRTDKSRGTKIQSFYLFL